MKKILFYIYGSVPILNLHNGTGWLCNLCHYNYLFFESISCFKSARTAAKNLGIGAPILAAFSVIDSSSLRINHTRTTNAITVVPVISTPISPENSCNT